jgi:DNA (cytosine-5)-methyltransferase 1
LHPSAPFLVVDLFCGCGGLSRGLERTGRFRTVLGIDNNRYALDTFVRNHGGGTQPPIGWLGDIRELETPALWSLLARCGVDAPGQLDCLVGGPPCEGFSRNKVYVSSEGDEQSDPRAALPKEYKEQKYWQTAWQSPARKSTQLGEGRSVQAYNPFLDDPRNYLFRHFLDIAGELQPRIVLIENVRQMLSHRGGEVPAEIASRLDELGYVTESRILNAASFGVPQSRHRAFFVAVRKQYLSSGNSVPWPIPTHVESAENDLFVQTDGLPGDAGLYVTVREAIADLPPARGEKSVRDTMRPSVDTYPPVELSRFRRFVRSATAAPANHVYRMPSEQVIARLRAMQPGMKPHHLPKELQTRKYYYNAYGRLEWDRPSNTITKSFLYPGSGKFGHPEESRVISYREAARLQSFDDDFTFYAASQEGIAHMIGSAVPPLLGYRFGEQFAAFLSQLRGSTSSKRVSA